MDFKALREAAAELKAAHDLQAIGQQQQSLATRKIVAMLGNKDAGEFLHMLRYQAEPPRREIKTVFEDCDEIGVENARAKFKVV
jgi:hypothetical protein